MAIKVKNIDVNDALRKRVFSFSIAGTLATGDTKTKIPIAGLGTYGGEVESCYLAVLTAPTGDSIQIQVANGASDIFSTKPQIAASALLGNSSTVTAANASVVDGDVLDIDVDNVGSSVAGADLTATLVVRLNGAGYNI